MNNYCVCVRVVHQSSWGLGHYIVEVHTQPHLRWDSAEREISSSHRPLPTQGFEPRDPSSKHLQTYALDCTVAGIGTSS